MTTDEMLATAQDSIEIETSVPLPWYMVAQDIPADADMAVAEADFFGPDFGGYDFDGEADAMAAYWERRYFGSDF